MTRPDKRNDRYAFWRELDGAVPPGPGAKCGDPTCPEEHGDEDEVADWPDSTDPRRAAESWLKQWREADPDIPLGPWGGPAPQPKLSTRRGLARAWAWRSAILTGLIVGTVAAGALGGWNFLDGLTW